MPHCSNGNSMREPMPSTRSTSAHSRWARPSGTNERVGLVHHAVAHAARRNRCLQAARRAGARPAQHPGRRCRPRSAGWRRRAAWSRRHRRRRRRPSASFVGAGADGAGRGSWPTGRPAPRWRPGVACPETSSSNACWICTAAVVDVAHDRRVLGDLTQHRRLVVELVEHADSPCPAGASGSARRSPAPAPRLRMRSTARLRR